MTRARKRIAEEAAAPPASYQPTDAERAAAARQLERRRSQGRAPRLKMGKGAGQAATAQPDHPDGKVWSASFLEAFGTTEIELARTLTQQVLEIARPSGNAQIADDVANAALAAVHGMAPRDATEGLLVTQMTATHFAAMEALRYSRHTSSVEQATGFGSLAVKLLRTYAAQVETLKRYRSGGEQRVKVEHVHVHPGGQAIVGVVTTGGRGAAIPEEQTHAKQIAHAPEPEMRSADATGGAVSVASNDGAEAVPDARRRGR